MRLFLPSLLVFISSALFAQESMRMPPGSLVRQSLCKITNDNLDFSDVVDLARNLPRDENSPAGIQFRRPIFASPEFMENWDFMVALYYPSWSDMVERRIADGNSNRGKLPISCNSPVVVRNVGVNPGVTISDQTMMTTRQCSLNPGANMSGAYNFAVKMSQNWAEAGNSLLTQLWMPGAGGPLRNDFDFVYAQVGPTREVLLERMDMVRNGFRAVTNVSAPVSCDRPTLWSTWRIHNENQ